MPVRLIVSDWNFFAVFGLGEELIFLEDVVLRPKTRLIVDALVVFVGGESAARHLVKLLVVENFVFEFVVCHG